MEKKLKIKAKYICSNGKKITITDTGVSGVQVYESIIKSMVLNGIRISIFNTESTEVFGECVVTLSGVEECGWTIYH